MVSLVDKEKWAPLIGRLFIAFGSIESVTHDCVRRWAGEVIYKHIKQMPLSRRIDLAIDLVQTQSYSKDNKEAFVNDFREAKNVVKKRNILAHSPLALVLFEEEDGNPFKEAIISDENSSKVIEFSELEGLATQAEKLSESIHRNMAAFRVENIGFDSVKNFKGL